MFDRETLPAVISALEMRLKVDLPERGKQVLERALLQARALERGDVMASIWTLEDVYSLCEDWEGNITIKITDAEAREVLANAERNHNAEIGINWDVLRAELDDVLARRDDDPNGGDGQDD